MDSREEKGLVLAATKHIRKGKEGTWRVPSQSDDGTFYDVDVAQQKCTCADHEVRQVKCKHLFAVEFSMKRETDSKGKVISETRSVRITYGQNWHAYDLAQTNEKTQFISLLTDLCKFVTQPPQGMGRPRLPMSDMVFATTFKVFSGFSLRRFTSDLQEAQSNGLIAKAPSYSSVSNYFDNPELTPILKQLIITTSLPLKAVESQFAVDSSGFGTSRFVRWFNKKYGREIDNREWVKLHLTCGVKTHVVTSVEISGWAANDVTYFKPLIEDTATRFQIAEISADKAYSSHKNFDVAHSLGASAFIPFKSNTAVPHEESNWAKAYYYYMLHRETFLEHYHRRSNVETVFSMIKSKFGDAVRSKEDTAQINEVLCKVLCHNICVLIQSMYELGIKPTFSTEVADVENASGY